jgi:hypothetical protein
VHAGRSGNALDQSITGHADQIVAFLGGRLVPAPETAKETQHQNLRHPVVHKTSFCSFLIRQRWPEFHDNNFIAPTGKRRPDRLGSPPREAKLIDFDQLRKLYY